VESLPNVGPVTARKILERFKTVDRVFNASEDDLKKVDGIGETIAKNIRRVIESEYIYNSPYLRKTQESFLTDKNKPDKEFRLDQNNQG